MEFLNQAQCRYFSVYGESIAITHAWTVDAPVSLM